MLNPCEFIDLSAGSRLPAKRPNVKSGLAAQVIDPGRRKDFLTEAEVERLIKAAARNRHGIRDAAIVQLMFAHGLRVSELTGA
jgi:integrase